MIRLPFINNFIFRIFSQIIVAIWVLLRPRSTSANIAARFTGLGAR